jgi:hypothetical protein
VIKWMLCLCAAIVHKVMTRNNRVKLFSRRKFWRWVLPKLSSRNLMIERDGGNFNSVIVSRYSVVRRAGFGRIARWSILILL